MLGSRGVDLGGGVGKERWGFEAYLVPTFSCSIFSSLPFLLSQLHFCTNSLRRMPSIPLSVLLLTGAVLLFATPAVAFGAGNIVSVSQVAGKNWRHGDIEETLLELFMSQAGNKKFDRLNVKRVYFVRVCRSRRHSSLC